MKECPKCGSDDLYDHITSGRKYQRGCHDCDWKEKPRVVKREIKSTKFILANQFSGFFYELYDGNGNPIEFSRSYNTYEEAKEALLKQMEKLKKFPEHGYGRCTGILWPNTVEVVGEVIHVP